MIHMNLEFFTYVLQTKKPINISEDWSKYQQAWNVQYKNGKLVKGVPQR